MLRKFAPKRSIKDCLLIAALAVIVAGCANLNPVSSSTQDWTTAFHDKGRTNSTPDGLGSALVPLWEKDIAPVSVSQGVGRLQFSSPAISDKVLYVGSTDKRLYAFDLATGKRLWKFNAGGIIESSPTITGKLVCFGSVDGLFRCLDRAEGRELWSFQAKSEIIGSALISNELIYLYSSDDRLYALNSRTGERVWVYNRVPFFTVSRRIISSPAMDDEGKRVYQLFSDGTLSALDAATGKLLWEKSVIKDFGAATIARRTPILSGKRLYVIDGEASILALSAEDGTEIDIDRTLNATDIVLSGNRLLVVDKNTLTLLDRTAAKTLWKRKIERGDISTLFIAGDKVVVLSSYEYEPIGIGFLATERGYVELLSLENGNSLWGRRLRGTVTGGASAGHGALAFLRNDGLLSLYTSK